MKKYIKLLPLLLILVTLSSCNKVENNDCLDDQGLINGECITINIDPVVDKNNLFNINTGNTEGWEMFSNFKDEPTLDVSNGNIIFSQVFIEGTQDSNNTWARKLAYSSMNIDGNSNYLFEFQALGSAGEVFTIHFQSGNENNFIEKEFLLDGTLQNFSFNIKYPITVVGGGLLKIGFGTFSDGSTVTLSNIHISKEEITEADMNILFIGNSITFFHEMPTMVEDMGIAKGHSINVDQMTYGGYQLSQFIEPGSVILDQLTKKLEETNWDYVIVQEHSFKPILLKEEFLESVDQINQLITSYNATTILFSTWAYREDSKMLENTGYTYTEFYNAITESYIEAEVSYNTLRAPVGSIFYNLRLEQTHIEILSNDDFHSNQTGSYVAALTFYTMIYGKEVNPYLPEGLKSVTAIILRDYIYKELGID